MGWEIAGFGNALMDALVVVNDESWLDDLKMQRGVAHMVEHTGWEFAYEKIRQLKVQFESGGSCANSIATLSSTTSAVLLLAGILPSRPTW